MTDEIFAIAITICTALLIFLFVAYSLITYYEHWKKNRGLDKEMDNYIKHLDKDLADKL